MYIDADAAACDLYRSRVVLLFVEDGEVYATRLFAFLIERRLSQE